MKPITQDLARYKAMHGWANRILRIDLSDMSVEAQEAAPYVPDYLGGRGIAARICWDEYPRPVEPFDPANPLMVFSGALTGSRSPYSGRTGICTFSPQAYPFHWFTRSNFGGHFGGELKRAGYDGIVVTGASDTPVRIRIRDDQVSILPADDLWGLDVYDTLDALAAEEGKGTRAMVIGPAGERLSRIATIHTASSSACGHGGFGAVMGAKRLKAISVQGTGRVSLADPERLDEIRRAVAGCARPYGSPDITAINEQLAREGGGRARLHACTESCLTPCGVYYRDVPGRVHGRGHTGHWFCVAPLLRGIGEAGPVSHRGAYDWRLGVRGGMEMNVLSNRYGLNQWEIIIGMVPWLAACQRAGLIDSLNGVAMDWCSPEFWDHTLHALAYREGMGDVLAEGGWAAAKALGLGEDLIRRFYTGWGFPGHWDGHADLINYIVYPFWLVAALQWATDTRDPIPSGHGYVESAMHNGPFRRVLRPEADAPISWEQMRGIAQRIYGDPAALDPMGEYGGKAAAARYHTARSVMKDCLPVDDFVFPMIYSPTTPDRIPDVAGIPGPSVEYHLFRAGTGVDWPEEAFGRAAERIYTLERAIQVRHWSRDRGMDESVLPAFEYAENWASPLIGERRSLDRVRFKPVMDDYYRRQGWDPGSGWPTRVRLEDLDLGDVYEPMVSGASAARAAGHLAPPDAAAVEAGAVPKVFGDEYRP